MGLLVWLFVVVCVFVYFVRLSDGISFEGGRVGVSSGVLNGLFALCWLVFIVETVTFVLRFGFVSVIIL